MAAADPKLKQLKIKTGVVNRLAKEKSMYEADAIKQEEKVTKMKENKEDEYDIRKQIEVLEECKMMVPDCLRRLKKAWEELQTLVSANEEFAETEEYKNAKTALSAGEEAAGIKSS